MPSPAASSAQHYIAMAAARMEAAGLCFGHGTDNAWDEACWLLETLLRREGISDIHADLRLTPTQTAAADALLDVRIATRKPLAYLLQEAWFCGVPFYVDERVLVPRSPLAELITNGFDPLLRQPPRRILDLCCGSGCIGLACALAFPEAEVVLADLSEDALAVAAINRDSFALAERVSLVQSDLFASLEGRFDLIVTNPPYVGQEEYDTLPEEFKREPALGLVSEDAGLDIPRRILVQAADYLEPEGVLVLETGATWELLAAAYPKLPFLWLEFEHGGEGVCALRCEELLAGRAGGIL
ncbi:MAG TPA: 50S ribosomal protein L3 N(5)-glutamine methyltransferase [Hyphomicrobiales bacterium]|nr:50S ribosomal protein L3 N(5)-glutamine methyltransferase [Hyphomicrobiales bacterium]